MPDIVDNLQHRGFALVAGLVDAAEVASLKTIFEFADIARAERGGETYGARNLLALSEVRRVAASPALGSILLPLLGPGYRAVRGIFFDKTREANWPVLWHQDLSLAVKARQDLPGWGGWSVKRRVQHVQAPAEVLARMVTMRLHLDDCPADNGPLRVIAGSHGQGQLARDAIRAMTADTRGDTIVASDGDALFMRPLILHASSPAKAPHHRRVLHLEFAPADLLPSGLEWAEAE